MLHATYKACTEPDPEDPEARPFTAQAIIANPPSYGHIHCAEKLGVPLHMVGGVTVAAWQRGGVAEQSACSGSCCADPKHILL